MVMVMASKYKKHFATLLFGYITALVWTGVGGVALLWHVHSQHVLWVYVLLIGVVLMGLALVVASSFGSFIDHVSIALRRAEVRYGRRNGQRSTTSLKVLYCRLIELYNVMQNTAEEIERDKQAAMREVQSKIKMKRELTNNINHELKTPIASISGYVETLMLNPDLEPEQRDAFLRKCYAQTERLASLLRDVSTISRLEETGLDKAAMEKIDIYKVVQSTFSDVMAARENQNFKLSINFSINTFVYGDPSLIQSIFLNLTNNSVAYSGGNNIFVRITQEDKDYYTFVFADNGMGVDETHIVHLFERFYRADKGRSRKMGGTGLGLAIVKNAVLQHRGRISVANGEYGGLQFTFTLPKHELQPIADQDDAQEVEL